MKPGDRVTYFQRMKGTSKLRKLEATLIRINKIRGTIKFDSGEISRVSLDNIEKCR